MTSEKYDDVYSIDVTSLIWRGSSAILRAGDSKLRAVIVEPPEGPERDAMLLAIVRLAKRARSEVSLDGFPEPEVADGDEGASSAPDGASQRSVMPRRQDLPDDAILPVATLRASYEEAPAHVRDAVLPIVAISYCWLTAQHPDPHGEQLEHIAEILEYEMFYEWDDMQCYTDYYDDMGVFWDWASIFQKDHHLFDASETPEAKAEGAERAAFLTELKAGTKHYGGQAYEESRSPREKEAFDYALKNTMDLWYAHQCTTVIFVTKLPPWFSGRTYDERGWTFFERCCAELIKPSQPFVFANEEDRGKGAGTNLWHLCIDSKVGAFPFLTTP